MRKMMSMLQFLLVNILTLSVMPEMLWSSRERSTASVLSADRLVRRESFSGSLIQGLLWNVICVEKSNQETRSVLDGVCRKPWPTLKKRKLKNDKDDDRLPDRFNSTLERRSCERGCWSITKEISHGEISWTQHWMGGQVCGVSMSRVVPQKGGMKYFWLLDWR